MWNGYEVFAHNSGNCGGTSHLMNFLLAGDFEEQGYVQFHNNCGGHIFNYFVYDGIYIFCDFVSFFGENRIAYVSGQDFVVYACTDMHEFGDWYRSDGPLANAFDDEDGEMYLYHLWMHIREGASLPAGFDELSKRTSFNNVVWDVFPEEYRDAFVILYEREDNPIRFRSIPPQENWPDMIK